MGLENLFCWVPWLIKWLMGWVPHIGRLHVYQRGVKVSGMKVKVLEPGWYYWLPLFSDIYADNVVRKVVELPEQLLTTKDLERVRVGGLLVFTIEQIEVWLLQNDDPDHGLLNEASRVLRDWVKSYKFAELMTHGEAKGDDLTMLATDSCSAPFGVEVQRLGMTSFARTASIDLYHAGHVKTGDGKDNHPLMVALGE